MKTGITERLWQLGVGMLTGWVVLDLVLLAVLKTGGRIESWHAGIWITAMLVGMWIAAGGRKTEDGGQISEDGRRKTEGRGDLSSGLWPPSSDLWDQIRISGALAFLALILPVAFSWILSHFTDFSWDGMTVRGPTVFNLANGQKGLCELSLGHVTGGFLAGLSGDWQGAKSINLSLLLISFCYTAGGLKSLGFGGFKLWLLTLLAALNPVSIYQVSSFQIDGQLASLFCCLVMASLRFWKHHAANLGDAVALLASFLALCLCKTSGIFYGVIVCLVLAVFLYQGNLLSKRTKRIFGIGVLTIVPAAVACYHYAGLGSLRWQRLLAESDIKTFDRGVGGGAARVQEYINLPRPVLFAASAFSMTEGSPEKINLKPPFWTTRREIRIFEDLFPDPRAGGFGPFYSTAFLLAGLGCLGLLAAGKWKYAPGWFLVLASFGSSYFSQIWWARWTPQNWLLVVGMLMTLLAYGFGSSRVGALRGSRVEGLKGLGEQGLDAEEVRRLEGWKGTWVRTFAVLGMVAAFLNVGIIALYYGIGMVRQERILDSQMYVASQLPQPLPIYLQREDYVFIASKYWLEERGISTREVAQNVDKPRMKINRTHTRFPLPENWRSLLRRPEDEKVLRERGLVEE